MNISFFLTQKQILEQSKFVTRRLGWKKAQVGQVLQPVIKGQGIPKGGKVEKLGCEIMISSVRLEKLDKMRTYPYGRHECVLEGFPMLDGHGFIEMFCKHNGCMVDQIVTRLEFKYLTPPRE